MPRADGIQVSSVSIFRMRLPCDWVKSIAELTEGQVVAVDGKTLRGCHDRARGRPAPHLVSARASQNHLVLGQTRTSAHSNEITAIPPSCFHS